MDIIDHGHKNVCTFGMLSVGACFRNYYTGILLIKVQEITVKVDDFNNKTINAISIIDGIANEFKDKDIVNMAKAHVEVSY